MTAASLRRAVLLVGALSLLQLLFAPRAAAQVPTPESHFGFRMGTDRQLATAADIEAYFDLVAARSDRVTIVDIGQTTEGHRTIAAIISAPDNIRHLAQIRADNQRLADPRTLTPDEARRLAATHKTVLAIGGGIHATEIGATQTANELLYWLATSADRDALNVLDNVVVVLIPSLNPDGHRLVVDWYARTKNTEFEGRPMPGLFHKYAGHDINRDAFMMNMVESRNLARFLYEEWHPQVWLSMHEMGSGGARMFVPPVSDPIQRNDDPLIWREAALLGGAMALELQRDARSGVVSNSIYDYYYPGYEDSAPLGHNTVCLLTEVASVNIASPIPASENGPRAGPGGLLSDAPRINYPDPWPGGRWTLRDIVDYELSAVRGLLYAAAAYRGQIVENFYEMGRRAIEQGGRGGPFAFIIPPEQYEPRAMAKLEELLMRGSIEIHRALEPFHADGEAYPAGSDIILLAQPYRAHVKTLLERQNYPARRAAPGGPPERPYDVTGWTLPAQMGVVVRTIERTFEPPAMSRLTTATVAPEKVWGDAKPSYYVIDARGNGGAIAVNRLTAAGIGASWLSAELDVNGYRYAPGSLVVAHTKTARPIVERIAADLGLRADGIKRKLAVALKPVGGARVALYKPWVENVDEGWTRWVLEQHEFRFKSLSDADVRSGDLRRQYDVVILPSASAEQLLSGYGPGTVPPEYVGGLGESGVAALRAFVEAGGTLVCLDQSGALAIDQFKLPLKDVVRDTSPTDFFGPGSIVRIDLDPAQPVAFGMNPSNAGFFAFSSAFEVAVPETTESSSVTEKDVQVVARYAKRDLLLSGWLDGESVISSQAAAVQVRVGAGRVVLLGFATQHRGQTHATFRLLFNSIFTAR